MGIMDLKLRMGRKSSEVGSINMALEVVRL